MQEENQRLQKKVLAISSESARVSDLEVANRKLTQVCGTSQPFSPLFFFFFSLSPVVHLHAGGFGLVLALMVAQALLQWRKAPCCLNGKSDMHVCDNGTAPAEHGRAAAAAAATAAELGPGSD